MQQRLFAGQATRTRRLALIVSLVTILAAFLPLASSSPPDPTWVEGVWDNADYDDIVILAMSLSSTSDANIPYERALLPWVFALVSPEDEGRPPAVALSSCRARAPPSVWAAPPRGNLQ